VCTVQRDRGEECVYSLGCILQIALGAGKAIDFTSGSSARSCTIQCKLFLYRVRQGVRKGTKSNTDLSAATIKLI